MSLSIHNTLTRRLEPLRPIVPGKVGLYVCGMTTYDYCHLGHARVFTAFDVIVRWLRASGYEVKYIRNITDVDDKIIRRAADNGETPNELTERFIRYMHEDFAALGLLPPDAEPRATQFVPQMLGIIDLLAQKGLAYQAEDGDVNFAVRKFPGYGKLSGKSLDDLRAGERVAVDDTKRDPLDFALWKHAKPGEPQWPSRWGAGRPGWHIECSAMSSETLGRHFDIHGGGPDLIFPHHENEIAQSEGAFGGQFANVWMHAGALRVGAEKMSKSLGNFLTIRDALSRYDWEDLRFFLLRPHYRHQINFTEDMITEARAGLTRLYTALRDCPPAGVGEVDWNESHAQRFAAAMNDDFNTALAVSVLFDLAGEVNRSKSTTAAAQLMGLGRVLGILQRNPIEHAQGKGVVSAAASFTPGAQVTSGGSAVVDEAAAIQAAIDKRAAAKKAKNYAEADRIRKELAEQGIVLEDTPTGTTWRRQ